MKKKLLKHGLSFLSIGVVVSIYLAVISTLSPYVFWSPDEGCKFLQMYGWKVGGPLKYDLPYPGKDLDPNYMFYPRGMIYPRPLTDGRVHFWWQSWFPLISHIPYKLFGLGGIYIIPLVSGLLSVVLAGIISNHLRRGSGSIVVLMVGLASPIMFYSLLFWEHTFAICLSMAALWLLMLMLTTPKLPAYIICVIALFLLSIAVAMRFEMLIFILSLLIAGGLMAVLDFRKSLAFLSREVKRMKILFISATAAILAFMGGWHIVTMIKKEIVWHPYKWYAIRICNNLANSSSWVNLPDYLRKILINNSEVFGVELPDTWVWAGFVGLGLCLLSLIPIRRLRLILWATGAVLVGSVSLDGVISPQRFRTIHSIFLPAPWLVLALLPFRHVMKNKSPQQIFVESLTVIYLILSLLAIVFTGKSENWALGSEWGTRYVLLIYPLLAVIGGIRFSTFITSSRSNMVKAFISILAAWLLIIGCGFNFRGVKEIWITKRDLGAFEEEIRKCSLPVVTDLWWLPAALAPTFVRQGIFTLAESHDLLQWLENTDGHINHFVYAGYQAFETEKSDTGSFRLLLEERKNIFGMFFSRYRIMK